MKKDIILVRIPKNTENPEEIGKWFNGKFGKWYEIIVAEGNVTELKVELLNPTIFNYIKYKFRNIFNYGK